MIPYVNKYTIGATILLALALSFWGWGRYQYHAGVTDARHKAEIAAAAQYAADETRINLSNDALKKQIEALQNVQPQIITKYRDIIKRVPLPGTCRIDADRLHSVQSAIHAANAAR